MEYNSDENRKIEANIQLSQFKIPAIKDVLLIGKKAIISADSIHRWANEIEPGKYEIIPLDHPVFELAVVKKTLMHLIPLKKLISIILKEGKEFTSKFEMINVQINLVYYSKREINLA